MGAPLNSGRITESMLPYSNLGLPTLAWETSRDLGMDLGVGKTWGGTSVDTIPGSPPSRVVIFSSGTVCGVGDLALCLIYLEIHQHQPRVSKVPVQNGGGIRDMLGNKRFPP